MSTCRCGNPTRDDAYTCDPCGDKLARALNEMPWLDDELETTIGNQRAANTEGGSRSAEKAMMFNAAASAKRDRLRHELVMAVRFCAEEGIRHQSASDDLPDDTLTAMARWLLWRVDGLALNDMGGEIGQAIIDAARACRRAIDAPPERRYAGPCPECSRDLYHRPDATDVKCHGCGQTWEVAEVNEWMEKRINEHMTNKLVTAREGATLLGRLGLSVEQGTIDKWHQRGRLAEAGRTPPKGDRDGHRLYRWEELLAVAARQGKASA